MFRVIDRFELRDETWAEKIFKLVVLVCMQTSSADFFSVRSDMDCRNIQTSCTRLKISKTSLKI